MSRYRLCRLLALSVLLIIASVARAQPGKKAVVLILAPDASLQDWRSDQTPALRRLTQTAAIGVMPTRAEETDPLSSYTVLATGTGSPSSGEKDLGATLRAYGVRTVALGGNGAQIVAGVTRGAYAEEPWRVRRPEAPEGIATDTGILAHEVVRTLHGARQTPLFAAVLYDDLARADDYAAFAVPRATAEQRRAALSRLDRLVELLTAPTVPPATLLVVTPRPSAEAEARGERLGPLLLRSPELSAPAGALLTSPSTRRTPGLVASTDIAASVAALLGLPPAGSVIGAGRPLETVTAPARETSSLYIDRRVANWAAQSREQKLLVAVPWVLAGALLALLFFPNGPRVDDATHRLANALGLWAASVPGALLIAAPLASPAPGQFYLIYVLAFGLSLLAPFFALVLRLSPQSLLRWICAITALVILADPFIGSPFLGRSPFSYSVIEAARFYGIGNEVEGTLLGVALISAAGAGIWWGAALGGILVAISFGSPGLGADFGGVLGAMVGFCVLALSLQRRRVSGWQIAALVVLAVIMVVALARWEVSRGPAGRTHVGQAISAAETRGVKALVEIAARKAVMDARLLVTSPWAVLLLAEAGTAWSLLRRNAADVHGAVLSRQNTAALRAIALASLTALLVNDSGVVAASTCLLYGAVLLSIALRDE